MAASATVKGRYSESEDAFLLDHPDLTAVEAAIVLKRSPWSVQDRRARLRKSATDSGAGGERPDMWATDGYIVLSPDLFERMAGQCRPCTGCLEPITETVNEKCAKCWDEARQLHTFGAACRCLTCAGGASDPRLEALATKVWAERRLRECE